MKLIIGGAYQGKRTYAEQNYKIEHWADGETCSFEDLFTCQGMDHFHVYVKRALEEDRDVTQLADQLKQENPNITLITNELGYGVVPMEAFDRRYREAHGRLCCQLAEEADEVVRVICGIGTVLKKVEE
jgi:adenosylcobinamide kinase/adenosylcobinamide-phosphate guanylyltransferase